MSKRHIALGAGLSLLLALTGCGAAGANGASGTEESIVAVENIQADLGLDIGATLIGMHLKPVAVPVRLSVKSIGDAVIVAARTRPKFIGGSRAVYDENLL